MQVETDALQMELCEIQGHRVEIFCPIAAGAFSLVDAEMIRIARE